MSFLVDVSDKVVSLDQALEALEANSETIVVISKSTFCAQCNSSYRSLVKKDLEFLVVYADLDEAARNYALGLGYDQVPVVRTPTDHWYGYREDKISALVKAPVTIDA